MRRNCLVFPISNFLDCPSANSGILFVDTVITASTSFLFAQPSRLLGMYSIQAHFSSPNPNRNIYVAHVDDKKESRRCLKVVAVVYDCVIAIFHNALAHNRIIIDQLL